MLRIILCLFLLLFAISTYAVSFVPISSKDQGGIETSIRSDSQVLQPVFLSTESFFLDFTLMPAQTGQGEIYIVARHNQLWYMLDVKGDWLPWNGNISDLQSYQQITFNDSYNIQVSSRLRSGENLSQGEYLVYAGYRIAEGDIYYLEQPLGLMISDEKNAALHRVQNSAFFAQYMKSANLDAYNYYKDAIVEDTAFSEDMGLAVGVSAPTTTSTGTASTSQSTSAISQTNLQEMGVDEADKIKMNGDILYALEQCNSTKNDYPVTILANDTVSISNSAVTSELMPVESDIWNPTPLPVSSNTCLGVYRLSESPASSTRLQQIEITTGDYLGDASGQLILDNNASQLIWLNSSIGYDIWTNWLSPYSWTSQSTQLQFFDLNQADAPSLSNIMTIEGGLVATRRIDDKLYLISRKNQTNNQMAKIQTSEQSGKQDLVSVQDCYLPASSSLKSYDGTVVSLTAVSLSDPNDYYSSCIAGNIETVYMSPQSLYVASSRYQYTLEQNKILYDAFPDYSTDIHKFALNDNSFDYKGSISVPGHLGWEADKRSFRMGESNAVLKVATSIGETWNDTSTTRVSVIEEQAEGLSEVATLENLGKQGEQLYAARFIGDKGYLVTFKLTDPLIVIDFSEPSQPIIQGELEISGYSDYLHPIGDNYLLGIGKEAIDASSLLSANGALYQGIKLSLFDVRSGTSPSLVNSVVIGQRGSQSAVLSDHHALAWLSSDNSHHRLVIPIDEHSTPNTYETDYSSPWAYYDWTQSGAYIFDITTDAAPSLSLSGSLLSEASTREEKQVYYSAVERVILQGDSVHYVHDNQVFSSAISH